MAFSFMSLPSTLIFTPSLLPFNFITSFPINYNCMHMCISIHISKYDLFCPYSVVYIFSGLTICHCSSLWKTNVTSPSSPQLPIVVCVPLSPNSL